MGFYRKVKYFLVHTLMLDNKTAQQLIVGGQVQINGKTIFENCLVHEHEEITVGGKVVRNKTSHVYLKFYKPAGFESTLNKNVNNNIACFFEGYPGLSIAGRLDKASEGLLLLSNNGKWVQELCNPDSEKEKEYLVTLDKIPPACFFEAFSTGVRIGKHTTKPCKSFAVNDNTFTVILTEGKNRQIRRMCWNLGYAVQHLKRTRIHNFTLDSLEPGAVEIVKI